MLISQAETSMSRQFMTMSHLCVVTCYDGHMQNFQQRWGVMLDGVRQSCPGQKLNSLEWPSEPCGLVTTRAIAHGDGLVAVPRQAVLFTADPEQLISEIALLAKPHMASILGPGHSAQDKSPCEAQLLAQIHLQTSGPVVGSLAKTTQQQANLADASGTHHQDTNFTLAHAAQQANVSSTHGLDTVPSHDDNTSAAAAHQKALLAELVKLWLRIGQVQLGWTAQLLLALLCKGHPQHAAAQAELNALAGELLLLRC